MTTFLQLMQSATPDEIQTKIDRAKAYHQSGKAQDLKHARGHRYGELIRESYEELSPLLVIDANEMIKAEGKLSIVDVGTLAIRYNLHLKYACEFLEWQKMLPTGTYERLKDRGLIVERVLIEARERMEVEA